MLGADDDDRIASLENEVQGLRRDMTAALDRIFQLLAHNQTPGASTPQRPRQIPIGSEMYPPPIGSETYPPHRDGITPPVRIHTQHRTIANRKGPLSTPTAQDSPREGTGPTGGIARGAWATAASPAVRVGVEDMSLERILAARPRLVDEVVEYIQAQPHDMYQIEAKPVIRETPIKSRYGIREALGCGAYGEVRRGIRTVDGRVVAIKSLSKELVPREDVDHEVAVMRKVHKALGVHSVALYEVYEDALNYSLVMERCSGSLTELVLCAGGKLQESAARDYTLQMLTAVQHLQQIGILHRDIKPDNILVCDNQQQEGVVLKLADFGLAEQCTEQGLSHSVGTPQWMAPEALWAGRTDKSDEYGYDYTVATSAVSTVNPLSVRSTLTQHRCRCVVYYLVCGYAPFYVGWKAEPASWAVGTLVWAKYSADDRWYEGVVEEVTIEPAGAKLRVSFNSVAGKHAEWKDASLQGDEYEVERADLEDEPTEGSWELQSLYDDICAANYEFKSADWSHVAPSAKHLVRCLLEVDSAQRVTANQAADHPWLITPEEDAADSATVDRVEEELHTLVLDAPTDGSKADLINKSAKRKKQVSTTQCTPLSTLSVNTTPTVRALPKKKKVYIASPQSSRFSRLLTQHISSPPRPYLDSDHEVVNNEM